MAPHQILIVAIRFLALIWFLYTASNVGTFYATIVEFENLNLGLGMLWASGLLQLAACVFLWLFPATVASKLLRDGSQPISSFGSIEHWQALVPIGVGLWVLARAVADLGYWLTFLVLRGYDEMLERVPLDAYQIAGMVTTLIELVVGAWLLLSGPAVTALLLRTRMAGLKNKLPDSTG